MGHNPVELGPARSSWNVFNWEEKQKMEEIGKHCSVFQKDTQQMFRFYLIHVGSLCYCLDAWYSTLDGHSENAPCKGYDNMNKISATGGSHRNMIALTILNNLRWSPWSNKLATMHTKVGTEIVGSILYCNERKYTAKQPGWKTKVDKAKVF